VSESALVGLWRLVSARREFDDGSSMMDIYGPEPRGWLMLAPGGRMMAFLSASERASADDRAAIARETMSYSGSYRVEGGEWVTEVDAAWDPSWVGTLQRRTFRIEGNELHVRTTRREHPAHPGRMGVGVIRWRREDAFG
jgi:hypothetical protein